jgi:nucleoside-diphosphate-sugar epimerase
MYAKDIAGGFVKFLDTEITGCVNICSAKPISIKEYAMAIAQKFGKENLIECQEKISNQPSFIVGDNSRLRNEVGYSLNYTLDMAIDEIIKDMKNE